MRYNFYLNQIYKVAINGKNENNKILPERILQGSKRVDVNTNDLDTFPDITYLTDLTNNLEFASIK